MGEPNVAVAGFNPPEMVNLGRLVPLVTVNRDHDALTIPQLLSYASSCSHHCFRNGGERLHPLQRRGVRF